MSRDSGLLTLHRRGWKSGAKAWDNYIDSLRVCKKCGRKEREGTIDGLCNRCLPLPPKPKGLGILEEIL